MNEVGLRAWRRVQHGDLRRWAGARLLAIGGAIVRAGRVRDLVRTAAGEVFATVIDVGANAGNASAGDDAAGDSCRPPARSHFAGVVMEFERRPRIDSLCTCERVPCVHAVAVAIAVRDAVVAHRTPPLMARTDRRCAGLPRAEPWESDEAFLHEGNDDGSWLDAGPP